MSEEYRNALPNVTVIDAYSIECVLGEGGCGITYLVRELNLEKLFAMKELLPDGIAMRRTGTPLMSKLKVEVRRRILKRPESISSQRPESSPEWITRRW